MYHITPRVDIVTDYKTLLNQLTCSLISLSKLEGICCWIFIKFRENVLHINTFLENKSVFYLVRNYKFQY